MEEFASTEEESAYESDSQPPSRPNRFRGHSRTYRRYIQQERAIHDSLEQATANDLAAHLYNAFALKRRFYRAETVSSHRSKATWIDPTHAFDWVPPKFWTAWPLDVTRVPALNEDFGRNASDDGSTYRRTVSPSRQRPYRDLRDVLMAGALKLARDQWNARLSDGGDEALPRKKQRRGLTKQVKGTAGFDTEDRKPVKNLKARSSGDESDSSSSQISHFAKKEFHQELERGSSDSGSLSNEDAISSDEESGADTDAAHAYKSNPSQENAKVNGSTVPHTKKRRRPLESMHFSGKPVVATDDDRSHRTLQLSVNSIISKLDTLFLSLAKSQNDHRSFRGGRLNADNSNNTDDVLEDTLSAYEGQMSSRPTSAHPSRPTSPEQHRSTSPVKRGRGRPSVYGKPRPGESYYYMRKRLTEEAALQSDHHDPESDVTTRPRPSTKASKPRGRKPPKSLSWSQTRSRSTTPGATSSTDERLERSGLRDWSEVLGMAALIGWDPSALSRASQRCADLFGEGMAFHTLHESAAFDRPPSPAQYLPQTIPPPSPLQSETEDGELSDDGIERYPLPIDANTCPHPTCPRHRSNKMFTRRVRLVDHVIQFHGYDPREIMESSEEEMLGGVHRDGFLKPIPKRPGWRARDVRPRRKGKGNGKGKGKARVLMEEDDDDDDQGEEMDDDEEGEV